MVKPDWNQIRQAAEQILSQRQHVNGDACFLSSYQLAYLMRNQFPGIEGDLNIGGKGEGKEVQDSLAKHVADCLAKDDRFERQWFCTDGVDSFTFDGVPSSTKSFSMFRITQ